jgi:hypothetical protein
MVGTAVVITVIVTTGTIVTGVIVTAVGAILALTRIVTVILTAVIAAIVTVIGVGAPLLVVIRPIIASAGVTPEALPGVAARLVRQGTLRALPPMTAPAGKFLFIFVYVALRGHPDEYLWLDKVVANAKSISVQVQSLCRPQVCFPFSPYYNSSQSIKLTSCLLCSPPFL